ncbi:MAG: carboxypeptidase regulatory-like domain-containing protein, partial [Planctomycetota bacterium]
MRLAAVGDRCWSPAPSLVVAGTSDARVNCQLGGSITGVVQSPTGGRAVSGRIRLAVRRTYATRVLPSYRIRPRSVTVDEDGRFRFAAVPVTDGLRLEVRADELAGTSVDLTPLAPGEERELEIRLPKGVRVEGRVVDDEGLALAGATFAILQAEPLGLPGAVLQSVDTDADGRFEFAQVRPEDVVGGLSAEGFASRLIDLEMRETSTEIDLGPLRLSRAETLEGRVLLPGGAPAVGATVKAERDQQQSNAEGFEEAWSESTGEAVTDESGRFEISGLEGEVFQLDVELEDGSDTWRSRVRGVQSREWLEIRLDPSIVASGAVRDVEGRPIEDFVLTFESARSGQFDVSSSERRTAEFTSSGGVWEFDGLLPGRWLLQAQSPGFAVGEPTEVELPTTEPIQLVLQPAGRVSGTVLDPRGRPISGAFVRPDEPWFEALRRGPRITTTTADDGTFVLDGLESGDVPLIAEHERYVASEPIVVEVPLGGEVSDLVVELRQGGSLRGRAYTREGEPSAGGQIMLVHASEVRPITRPLDPEGRFEIVRIEPGSYQAVSFPDLSNELTDGNDDSLTSRMLTEAVTELIEIREGEVTELVLGSPLSDPVRVSGQVRAGGIGSQYSLTFLPESDVGGFERMRQLRTDSAGRYDLVLHEPGNFVISVTRGLAPSPRISEQTFLRTIPDTDEYRLDFDLPVTSLGGRVVDLEGLPLIGVPVRAASVEGSTYASLVGLASASTVTDENGRYVFELLPPGTYSVQAGGPGSAISRSVDDTRGASVAPEVVLTEGAQIDDLDFELSTGLSLRGIVLDAAGDPVRQANVFVRN